MGLADFFTKRGGGRRRNNGHGHGHGHGNGGRNHNHNRFSSSDDESSEDDSYYDRKNRDRGRDRDRDRDRDRQRTKTRRRRKSQMKAPPSSSSHRIDYDSNGGGDNADNADDMNFNYEEYDTNEVLTKEELFELPARQLRKKCKAARIDTRNVFEKADLVSLLHDYYRRRSSENIRGTGAGGGTGMGTSVGARGGGGGLPLNVGEVSNLNVVGSNNRRDGPGSSINVKYHNNNHSRASTSARIGFANVQEHANVNASMNMMGGGAIQNDAENEQMLEVIGDIVPYFNQGDAALDEIVKDTIERLPPENLETRDQNGNSILMICCQCGAFELLPLLLSKGCDPNTTNRYGETCLHFTSYTDTYSPESAKILVQNGAKAEIKELRFGCTSLHYAASVGDTELCRILLEGGAVPTSKDNSGCDAIAYATQSKKQECIDLLKDGNSTGEWMQNQQSESKTKDDTEWEQLIDDQSGFPYFYNRNTGNSMWADEYKEYKNSKIRNKTTPMAFVESKRENSFRRAPSSFSEAKSSRSIKDIGEDIGNRSSGTPSRKVQFAEEKLEIMSNEGTISESKDARYQTPNVNKTRRTSVISQVEKDFLDDDLHDVLSDCSVSTHSECKSVESGEDLSGENETEDRESSNNATNLLSSGADTPAVNSKKLVSYESFDMRLESFQEKLLKRMEKASIGVDDKKFAKQTKEPAPVTEISTDLEELYESLETKDDEINHLKLQIQEIKNDADSYKSTSASVRDVVFGDNDVRDEMWVDSSQFGDLQKRLAPKDEEISELQSQCLAFETTLAKKESLLRSIQDKDNRSVEQMQLMEDLLKQEKDEKNKYIILLEETQVGLSGNEEVAKSLKEEKQRSDDLIFSLRSDMKAAELKMANEHNETTLQLEESQRKMLHYSKEISSLREQLNNSQLSHEGEKANLIQQQKDYLDNLLSKHQAEIASHDRDLRDQRNKRTEAERKAKNVEMQFDEMSHMVKEAKSLVAANVNLHKYLDVERVKRKELHNKLENLKGRIRVFVRIRPLNKSEISMKSDVALVKEDKRTCVMKTDQDRGSKSWEFDQCFTQESQEDIFKDTKELITSAIDGFNVCIFCYGQTGSGKTYTMFGPSGEIPQFDNINNMGKDIGLAPRAAAELFKGLEERKASFEVTVQASMFELYNDNIRDLIACSNGNPEQNLRIKLAKHSESGLVEVDGALYENVEDAIELLDIFRKAATSRSTASTKMNADSSRSHSIATMVTKLVNKRTGQITSGKVTLVDLAGSERVSKSGATGVQLKEAQSINKSLSALGDVINALTSGNPHIPYRNHPLTMLMSDSIGGNAKTLMFVCCSPASFNSPETGNSLDFAKRCKNVTNTASQGGKAGESAKVKALKAELTRMKRERGGGLQKKASGPRRPGLSKR